MSKTIKVQLRGRFVKDDLFSLQTVSVHKGIINLLDRDSALIVSLIEDSKNMTDLSLLVPELFSELDLRRGHILINRRTKLCSIEVNGVTIDYSSTPLREEKLPLAPQPMSGRLKELKILCRIIEPGESLFCIFSEGRRNMYQSKAQSLLKDSISVENRIISGMENLIGLGQGLTPSGDDFITGALLGEISSGSAFTLDREKMMSPLERTTYAGKTLLYQAIRASFPAYLLTFLNELHHSAGDKHLLKTFQKAAQHGSTSGLDSLAGFYWFFHQTEKSVFS